MTPFIDPIVEEVRKIRERRAAELGFDLGAIIADARKREAQAERKVVSFVPRRRSSAKSNG